MVAAQRRTDPRDRPQGDRRPARPRRRGDANRRRRPHEARPLARTIARQHDARRSSAAKKPAARRRRPRRRTPRRGDPSPPRRRAGPPAPRGRRRPRPPRPSGVGGARRRHAGDVARDVGGRGRPRRACATAGPRFVSRGGEKLRAALDRFAIDVAGAACLDAGASTGGFTDCLLQAGAARVVAVDVGYGQLAWSLREDPRVIVRERTNVRDLRPGDLADGRRRGRRRPLVRVAPLGPARAPRPSPRPDAPVRAPGEAAVRGARRGGRTRRRSCAIPTAPGGRDPRGDARRRGRSASARSA